MFLPFGCHPPSPPVPQQSVAHWGRAQAVGLQAGATQPTGLYQGALQEEYGCHAHVLVGGQPAVPAAAAEAALGLGVQVELGAEAAILPAFLFLPGRALLRRKAGRAPVTAEVARTCGPARPLLREDLTICRKDTVRSSRPSSPWFRKRMRTQRRRRQEW